MIRLPICEALRVKMTFTEIGSFLGGHCFGGKPDPRRPRAFGCPVGACLLSGRRYLFLTMPFTRQTTRRPGRHLITLGELDRANQQVTGEMKTLGFWYPKLENVTVWLHSLERRIVDLVHLAQRLPRYLVFENGTGAGATLPQHHHFQALKKWPGLARYPIEAAARVQEEREGTGKAGQPFVLRDYPVAALCWHGTADEIVASITATLSGWLGGHGTEADWRHLTTNLIATRESLADPRLRLFVIPRNAHITRATGLAGAVASLELAGELVFAQEQERDRIAAGQVSYASVWETLASAQDSGSRGLLGAG